MKVVVDRKNRGNEGVALCVRAFDHPLQYKIDIWSLKDSGEYRMRLDGFGHLKMYRAEALPILMLQLSKIPVIEVIEAAEQWYRMISELLNAEPPEERPEVFEPVPELTVAEYFEAARNAMLKELGPLTVTSEN